MKSRISIRFQPTEAPKPIPAPMPVDSAQHWRSPFDADGLQTAVKVFISQLAYSRICVHTDGELDEETGGVLVGRWCADLETNEEFIIIENTLPARYTRQGSVYLTFTQDTLIDFHNEIEARFPGKQIVGWYHTHPRMGIFLSHYDTWMHTNFFPEPWQVALVVEPHKQLGGVFIRQTDGDFDPSRYFGFYELEDNPEWSIVHWNNLYRNIDNTEEGG